VSKKKNTDTIDFITDTGLLAARLDALTTGLAQSDKEYWGTVAKAPTPLPQPLPRDVKICHNCLRYLENADFSKRQWKRKNQAPRYCISCNVDV